jgi:hypothetical protein
MAVGGASRGETDEFICALDVNYNQQAGQQ